MAQTDKSDFRQYWHNFKYLLQRKYRKETLSFLYNLKNDNNWKIISQMTASIIQKVYEI